MRQWVIAISLLFLLHSGKAMSQNEAASKRGNNDVLGPSLPMGFYRLGELSTNTPLSLFLPERITKAHPNLFASASEARPILEREVREHPDDLAAWVGYLQTIPEQWGKLIAPYQKEAKEKDTVVAHFKLGVLLLYRALSLSSHPDRAHLGDSLRLNDLAGNQLRQAYTLNPIPLTGMMYGESGRCESNFHESLLRRFSNEQTYQTYLRAKKSGWTTPQPDLPNKSRNELLILRRIVALVYRHNSGRTGIQQKKIINGISSSCHLPRIHCRAKGGYGVSKAVDATASGGGGQSHKLNRRKSPLPNASRSGAGFFVFCPLSR